MFHNKRCYRRSMRSTRQALFGPNASDPPIAVSHRKLRQTNYIGDSSSIEFRECRIRTILLVDQLAFPVFMNQQSDESSKRRLFDDAYAWHSTEVLAFLKSRVYPKVEDAEDLAQDVWLRFRENLGKLQPDSNYRAWLFQVAHRLLIDRHRTHRSTSTIHTDDGIIDIVDYRSPDGDLDSVDDEERLALRECLTKLSPKQQAIVLLRMEGTPHEAVAEKLKIKAATVMTSFHRAKAVLLECIQRKVG